MKSVKILIAVFALCWLGSLSLHGQALQTVYTQSLGPVASTAGCTASTGAAVTSSSSPCGGQGSMYQNSLVTSMTLSWTAVATVSTCTVQLEQATTLTGTYTALGTAQTCTSSGTYVANVSAAYVRFNITALTTSGSGSVTVNYFGQVAPPANVGCSGSNLPCTTVVMTAAQVLALAGTGATDFVIVPAQGAGKLLVPVFASINLNYPASGGAAFATCTGNLVFFQTSGTTHNFTYTSTNYFPSLGNASLTATSSQLSWGAFTIGAGTYDLAEATYSNNSLNLNLSNTTACTAGNSTLTVTVWYQVVSIS